MVGSERYLMTVDVVAGCGESRRSARQAGKVRLLI